MTQVSVRVIDCWIFSRDGEKIRFLLMRRSAGLQYAGIWHCVHGKIQDGETAAGAALRELEEETGFLPLSFWTVDGTSSFYEAEGDVMNLVPVFAAEVEPEMLPQLSAEHDAFEWLSAEDAIERAVWRNHREALERLDRMMKPDFMHRKWLEINTNDL